MIKEIEDLAKAIDLGQQMAEILKKSQMSLFGDPHHVGYERTNASGTMSHIQAKGAPKPKSTTKHDLPDDVIDAHAHASVSSSEAWELDKENAYGDTKNPEAVRNAHDKAEAALVHSANLHEQAANKIRAVNQHAAKHHERSAEYNRKFAEEHGARSHSIWTSEQQAAVEKTEPTEHEQHVAKLVSMTHEAVAKIAQDPKMAEHSVHIQRKLEALKANPTAKAAHEVLYDVKMMVEKASAPKVGKTEAEASEHLQQVSNRYVKRMHSKLEKFSHADNDDAKNGYPPHIPAKEVEGTEARQHTMGEVYGTHPKTYKGEIVPGGTSFSKEFMEKQEANGHNSFILKHTNGNRYLVDSQGYDYARYISKIKEEPKTETPAPTAAQTKPAIPTSRVTVETTEHEMSHGKMPKGAGRWMFSRNRKIDFANHKEGEDYITTPHMPYAEAKKHAKQWAASKGHGLIWTMP